MTRALVVCLAAVGFAASLYGQAPSTAVTFERVRNADREPHNWLTFSRTLNGQRHSPLMQVAPANVKNLEMSWIWQARSAEKFEATPLVVDGVLYTVQPPNDVVALDAATGRVKWAARYAASADARLCCGRVNRGLAIQGDTLFMGTIDAHLLAIDAKTGHTIWNTTVADFADPSCRPAPAQPAPCYAITHAPLVVKDKVIVGTAGGDTQPGQGTRGFLAAFDVATGKEVWRFYTIPGPGEPGHDSWAGNSWKTGGASIWNTGAYDPDANLIYWGTGNPAPWGIWDPARAASRLGDNLYSDSVIALDADTGRLKWHYQFTPHDDMDWDAAQVPVLTDLQWKGTARKVMLWANKNGLMYVLDRLTGEFLLGKPFVEVNWMSGFDGAGRPLLVPGRMTTSQAPASPANNLYLPRSIDRGDPALRVSPGTATNWAPPSYSPGTGWLYVPAWERGAELGIPLVGKGGYSAIRAIDPYTGERRWEFRMDEAIFSGVLTTATGLVFAGTGGDFYSASGATARIPRLVPDPAYEVDGLFFALDGRSGKPLWKVALGGTVTGAPISYAVDGKQYIAVNAGHSLFAFALPGETASGGQERGQAK